MNLNREICIIARRAIIERIALLYNGILLLCLKFHYIAVQCINNDVIRYYTYFLI